MTALNKQAQRMRNYLDTALKSGVKLLHLSTDELEGLLDELEAAERRMSRWLNGILSQMELRAGKAAPAPIEG